MSIQTLCSFCWISSQPTSIVVVLNHCLSETHISLWCADAHVDAPLLLDPGFVFIFAGQFPTTQYVCCGLKHHPTSMNESYASLSKFQEPCRRPMSIQTIWQLIWTSLSKCPHILLWVNTCPSTILVVAGANAPATSTFSHQNFYMFMGINTYPHCIQILCLWNSMLLWANAHVNSIFVAMRQHPSNDHICHNTPPHPNFQMHAYELIPTQVPYLFLRMQCACKFCTCCCGPIAIQNVCVHGDGTVSQLHPN